MIGSFKKLIDNLNAIDRSSQTEQFENLPKLIESAVTRARKLVKQLQSDQDVALVIIECRKTLSNLPTEVPTIKALQLPEQVRDSYKFEYGVFERFLSPFPKQELLYPGELKELLDDHAKKTKEIDNIKLLEE